MKVSNFVEKDALAIAFRKLRGNRDKDTEAVEQDGLAR